MAGDKRLEHPSRLPAALRDERLAQGLTLEWVADKVGVKPPSIHEFEMGKKRPTEDNLRRWVRALKLPDAWADDGVLWATAQAMVRSGKVRQRMSEANSEALAELVYRQLRGMR